MPPRISPDKKKKPHPISIEDQIWLDIEYVARNKYNMQKVSPLIRTLIVAELKKSMPEKYNGRKHD